MADEPENDDIFNGRIRPRMIPKDWIGSPTASSAGWRWDDPSNTGNSVRFFRGRPSDPDPSHQEDFVIVIKNGRVLDSEGNPVMDDAASENVKGEHY